MTGEASGLRERRTAAGNASAAVTRRREANRVGGDTAEHIQSRGSSRRPFNLAFIAFSAVGCGVVLSLFGIYLLEHHTVNRGGFKELWNNVFHSSWHMVDERRTPTSPETIVDGDEVVGVVGGGMAGLATVAGALKYGSGKVVLIEKDRIGGNSVKATSGLNAVGTAVQLADREGRLDSIDTFVDDIMASGKGLSDVDLARALAAESKHVIDFLLQLGVNFTSVERLGGSTYPRTHRLTGAANIGGVLVKTLKDFIFSFDSNRFQILEFSKLVDVEFQDCKDALLECGAPGPLMTVVKALKYETKDDAGKTTLHSLPVHALVLASGGYANDRSKDGLIASCAPTLTGYPSTNGFFATGDGVKIGRRLGLATLHLDKIQLHPTGFVSPTNPFSLQKFLCPEVFRGVGAILLNRKGHRFTNELQTRDEVSTAIIANGSPAFDWGLQCIGEGHEQCYFNVGLLRKQKVVAIIINGEIRKRIGEKTVGFYESKGFVRKSGNLSETADVLGVPYDELLQTFKDYAASFDASPKPDEFGKTVFPARLSPDVTDLSVAFVTPSTHYTMGGLQINSDCQVCVSTVMPTGSPENCKSSTQLNTTVCRPIIANFFASGEVAGGLHGGNRLGGNGLLESLAFGTRAGARAAAAAKSFASGGRRQFAPNPLAEWTKVDVRDVRGASSIATRAYTAGEKNGNIRLIRLNLPSPLDVFSGKLGQRIQISDTLSQTDKFQTMGVLSAPGITSMGYVDILVIKAMCNHQGDLGSSEAEDCQMEDKLWATIHGEVFYVRLARDEESSIDDKSTLPLMRSYLGDPQVADKALSNVTSLKVIALNIGEAARVVQCLQSIINTLTYDAEWQEHSGSALQSVEAHFVLPPEFESPITSVVRRYVESQWPHGSPQLAAVYHIGPNVPTFVRAAAMTAQEGVNGGSLTVVLGSLPQE